MKIYFHTYKGLAGDLQELLIGETEDGYRDDELFTVVGWFKNWNLKQAKKKILKRLELKTGRAYTEI